MKKFTFLVTQTDTYQKEITVLASNGDEAQEKVEAQMGEENLEVQSGTYVRTELDFKRKK